MRISILIILNLVWFSLFSQQTSTKSSSFANNEPIASLQLHLAENGFYNLALHRDQNKLLLTYENRNYRFEVDALKEVVKLVSPQLGENDTLVLVIQSRNIPIVALEIPKKSANQLSLGAQVLDKEVTISSDTDDYWNLLKIKKRSNLSFFKPEIIVEPELKVAFGGTSDPFVHQLNLLPSFNMLLCKGMSVSAQGIIPLTNEFDIPDQSYVRPGLLTINQYFKLPYQSFVGLTAGYFTNYNYGGEIELSKFFLNNNLLWSVKLGYTGYASYPIIMDQQKPIKGWQYSKPYYINYSAGLSYRIPQYDLTATLVYGKYLFDNKAINLELKRQMNELDIGFFAYHFKGGYNFGLKLFIPIPPKKYFNFKHIILMPAKSFFWKYNATNNYVSQYQTGQSIDKTFKKLNPAFLQNQLGKLRK